MLSLLLKPCCNTAKQKGKCSSPKKPRDESLKFVDKFKDFAVGERPMGYQLVGEVTAHLGKDV